MAESGNANPFLKLFEYSKSDGNAVPDPRKDESLPSESNSERDLRQDACTHELLQRVLKVTLSVDEEDEDGKRLLSHMLPLRMADGDEILMLSLDMLPKIMKERLTTCSEERIKVAVDMNSGTVTLADGRSLDWLLSDHCMGYLFSCCKRLDEVSADARLRSDAGDDVWWQAVCDDVRLELLCESERILDLGEAYGINRETLHNQLAVLLYNGTPLASEFLEFFREVTDNLDTTFKSKDADAAIEDLKQVVAAVLPLFGLLRGFMNGLSSRFQVNRTVPSQYFTMFEFFMTDAVMSRAFMQGSTCFLPSPGPGGKLPLGRSFELESILGLLLSCSSIVPRGQANAFADTKPLTGQDMSNISLIETAVRQELAYNCTLLSEILVASCRSNAGNRRSVLMWVSACLFLNEDRAKTMTSASQFSVMKTASDGFFLNLGHTLLLMCSPFLEATRKHLSLIDPAYASYHGDETTKPDDSSSSTWHPMLSTLHKETRVTTVADGTIAKCANVNVGFTTECFFLTHRSLHLGLIACAEAYRREDEAFSRMHAAYQQGRLNQQVVNGMIRHQLGCATHLFHPDFLLCCMRFYHLTSAWLIKCVLPTSASDTVVDVRDPDNLSSKVAWPLTDLSEAEKNMSMIPEFVLESVADFIKLLRHAPTRTVALLEESYEYLSTILSMLVIFMSHKDLVKNPHLRAKLAESIVWLLPQNRHYSTVVQQADQMELPTVTRARLFASHSLAKLCLPAAILQVFVDIEFTGQTEQFEQKFQYRHPILTILEYILPQPGYFEQFVKIANESVDWIESSGKVHVFTRFVNMIVNDATFLLDEAMGLLMSIRELEVEQDAGKWESLEADGKRDKQQQLAEAKRLARPHNFLANTTVKILAVFCSKLVRPFTCSTMLDRMVAFLNYFLKQLVGPKMGALKVKDFEEHAFKPRQLVKDIVSMYLSLASDDAFVRAVPADGRSYSATLLSQTRDVLGRTLNDQDMLSNWFDLSERIIDEEKKLHATEQALANAPSEFLDPLMNHVMSDPVKLPTSGTVVDRVTIMRHLLTDQIDPFNRAHLTPEMLEALPDLQRRIQEWKTKQSSEVKDQDLS